MQAAVQALIARWRIHGHSIGFGVGLAKGPATVGCIGYEGRHEYTEIGSIVNLASRICATAEDWQILIDATVAAEVGEAVHWRRSARILYAALPKRFRSSR
jgi:adenylate cyclase